MQRLILSNFKTGLETDLTPFNINNDAFPLLTNFFIWRGRVFKKRGIQFLGRLQRNLEAVSLGTSGASPWAFNIFTILGLNTDEPDAQLIPDNLQIDMTGGFGFLDQGDGTLAQYGAIANASQANPCQITSNNHNLITGDQVTITGVQGMTELNNNTYTITVIGVNDFTLDGVDSTGFGAYTTGGQWISTTAGNTGTVNYSNGNITLTHTAGAGVATTATFGYYPCLPVMGLEDFNVGNSPQPILLSFDTNYSYGFNQGTNIFYDTTFYKTTETPFVWNGENYDQFWTTNYLGVSNISNTNDATGCIWATNGNPGFHYLLGTYTAGTGTNVWDITFTDPSAAPFQTLVVGDILFFNEWAGSTDVNGINGTVSAIVNAALGQYQVTFVSTPTVAVTLTGIVQMMTNFLPDEDGIRWYDGDPTSASAPNNPGWVNFAPPLSEYNPTNKNSNPEYLIGCKIIIPFKNRLLCGGVYTRTSIANSTKFYPNRFIYSQVGTPYYSLPLPADLSAPAFNLSADPAAWYQISERGGFIGAPIPDQIITVGENEDLLIVQFESQPLKLISTSNDTLPFVFQTISAELGALGTFSGIKLDTGILSLGTYGFTMTTSTSVQRIDLQIPDEIFTVAQINNKDKRITAIRDFQKEFVYFTFCPNNRSNTVFNSRTLAYNYRENIWSVFDETFTTYGTFRRSTDFTWASIRRIYPTWASWNNPWNFGLKAAFQPVIIGGNQQGFVMFRSFGTSEQKSKFIQSVSGTTITSPDHGLQTGDYILIEGMLGSTNLNGTVQNITVLSADTFDVTEAATGTYIGDGVYTVFAKPDLRSKQFPINWGEACQTRIGTTRYLFETNSFPEEGNAPPQVTVNLFASQNDDVASNDPNVQPYLPFTNTVLTCPEIDTGFAAGQTRIWHRLSTSIIGDTVQFGITLNDDQMKDTNLNQKEIVLHAVVMDLYKGPTLV